MPFFNKELSSAHKKRTQLWNYEIVIPKMKRFILNNQFFVSLLQRTKKSTMPI